MTQDELLRLIDEAAADGRPTLDLAGMEIDELPLEIGKLTKLRSLVLGRLDRKRGRLGNNLRTLPDEIGQLTELRSLDLRSNQLSALPEIVGQLQSLRSLNLSFNKLTTLPEWVGILLNLRVLNLQHNSLLRLPEVIGQLKNLKELNLIDNQLTDLPESIGQLSELRTLTLESGNRVKKLPRTLKQLTKLENLNLGFNRVESVPTWLNNFARLQSLNLTSNQLSDLPESVGQLQSLKSLNLSYNQLSDLPEIVGQLQSLQSLYLRDNQLSDLPEIVGQLQSLQSLYLRDNQLSDLPEIVGQLQSLQSLYLTNNQLSDLPEIVGQLQSLQSLNLRNNQLSDLPEIVGQLQSLQSLYLRDNQLSDLPEIVGQLQSLQSLYLRDNQLSDLPEIVGQLQSLQSLDLRDNQLSDLPEIVGQLQSLQSLYLTNNQLSDLPEIVGQLQSLQSLDLRDNQLSDLPEIVGQLQSLQSLDLTNNQLSDLPEIVGQLQSLQSLDLTNNQLSDLPKWAKALESLKRLDLRGNPLPIPPEILGPKGFWQDPSPATETLGFYFSLQAETGSVPLYEAKLILIGEGGAGKTSLAKKIDSEDYELTDNEKSTEGIDVIRWDFPLPDGNTFRVNIWDFGGQEIYHATHQFFLTKRSLYLLVADTRQENTDFYYWLKIVELLADNSPVLIIKNEKQDRQCDIDEGLFKKQFNNLKDALPTNLKDKENRGLADIKDAIRYHIRKLPHVGNPLPKIWVRVRAALENYAQNCNTLTVEQYCDLCRQNGFTDTAQMLFLSSYLHDLGVCLHFQDDKLLKRTIILKPEWATTAVYKVADSNTVRNNKGRFTEADTAEIWADSEYADLRDELLQLMMRFKLAYELPNNPGNYIAPQLLPVSKPDYPWDATNNLILRYRYDFMPKGILTRFIVETHQRIEHQDHVWKNGVVLKDNWARAEIIENYPKSEITVRVSGTNKKPLLEVVRGELWKIHQSYERLQYDELIPCNCSQCKGSDKPEAYPYDLLMKYIGDHRYDIECRTSYEKVDVRRLISDISSERTPLDNDTPNQSPPIHYGDIYHQYGSGDNVAGKKVAGNNIETQNNSPEALAELSQTIDQLIAEISEDYNLNKPTVGNKIQRDAIERLEEDPNLKKRLTNALKAGAEETLEQMVKNPFAKIFIKSAQGFLKNSES